MSAGPLEQVFKSTGVRVQRFGTPVTAGLLLARLFASVAVATGVAGLAALWGGAESLVVGLSILAGLGGVVALLAALPLTVLLASTGIMALAAPVRNAVLRVGKSVLIERGRDAVELTLTDVAAVDADTPGWATIRTDDGDVIRVQVDETEQVSVLARALSRGGGRGPWLAPLQPVDAPPDWPRRLCAGLAGLGALVAIGVGHGGIAAACFVGAVGLLLWLTVLRLRPVRTRVAVGSDGVSIRSDVTSRFVPFARVERIEPADHGAVLVLGGGERLALSVVPPSALLRGPSARARLDLALLRRGELIRRLEASLAGGQSIAGAERLVRQGRSLSAWREAVRELVKEDAAGYRAAPLPPEQAARIVEAGRLPPEARIGAALALAGRADAALRVRLRIAVEDCADEATRSALSEALDDRLQHWTLDRVERTTQR